MSEMVEAVARAIEPHAYQQFDSLRNFCLCNGDDEAEALRTAEWAHGHEIRRAREKARAAIEAMREPTDEMMRQMEIAGGAGMRGVWWMGIDAALSEVEG